MSLKLLTRPAHNVWNKMTNQQGAPQGRRFHRTWTRVRLGLVLAAVWAVSHENRLWAVGSHKKPTRQSVAADPSYASALATANRFLYAWQTGDLETGMVLFSDRVRHAQNPEIFEKFFASEESRGF